MPKITDIRYFEPGDRYYVDIDNKECTHIRGRTFKGMGLSIGHSISCEQLKEMENFHFKLQYQHTWSQEKVRLDKVKTLIHSINPSVVISVVGFGANSNELIKSHPKESGKPDIEVSSQSSSSPLMAVEVTGTNRMRGNDYWVRLDKLNYSKNHPEENVWIVLHYAEPHEKFVFIKPNNQAQYTTKVKEIRGTDEHYVVFDDFSPEVKSQIEFSNSLNSR